MRAPAVTNNIGLHRFALFTAGCTAFLIFVGGLVTSTESGLAVPDWPLSYGMFFPPMVGGIFYEHGHRMVASFVGFLTVILAVWTCLKETRRWVRWLSVLALAAVIVQGVLGGLTVLYLLPTPISVTHALLAQTFFCLTIALALFTSPNWKRGLPGVTPKAGSVALPVLCSMTTGFVYAQLILGALMRHTKSGLAIPDFPLAFGRLIPPLTSDKIVVHFAHRMGAVVVAAMIIWTFARIARCYRDHRLLYRPALAMLILAGVQITLGALTIWTGKAVIPTTAHVATGALVLGTSFLLTVRAFVMSGANASPTGRSHQVMSGANASPTGRSHQVMSGANASPTGRSHQVMSAANASPTGRSHQVMSAANASPTGRSHQVMSGANASPTGRSHQVMSGANASPTGRSHQVMSGANASPTGRSHQVMSGANASPVWARSVK